MTPVAGKYGHVTVGGWVAHRIVTGRELAVYVDGEDVTGRCRVADDVAGFAVLFRTDAAGRFYVGGDGRPAREIRRGAVEISERGAA